MRTLKFIVDKQLIKQDPECDFSGLVPGAESYLKAEFSFSDDWEHCVKVATFRSIMGKEYAPSVLQKDNTCFIPAEALKHRSFKIGVIGRDGRLRIPTNLITVKQDGGKT